MLGAAWSLAVPIGPLYSGISTLGAAWSLAVPIGHCTQEYLQ